MQFLFFSAGFLFASISLFAQALAVTDVSAATETERVRTTEVSPPFITP
jgi:hypothetical protein